MGGCRGALSPPSHAAAAAAEHAAAAAATQGRIASEITREELSECFNMPSEDAAKKLGVGLTVLKRICRKFGVPRWPYRKLKSLDRLITNVEVGGGQAAARGAAHEGQQAEPALPPPRCVAQSGTPPGDTYKHLMKSAEEIREHQKAMCTGHVMELDDKTKKLQQAYSKFNHKLRKAAKDDDPCGMQLNLDGEGPLLAGWSCAPVEDIEAVENAPSLSPERATELTVSCSPCVCLPAELEFSGDGKASQVRRP